MPLATYEQFTGKFLDAEGNLLGVGYAGHGQGTNNPGMQFIHNVGPLPQGIYTALAPIDTATHGPYVMWLVPDKNNTMSGRAGFGIHGARRGEGDQELSSLGCIVMARDIREKIWASVNGQENGDKDKFQVVSGIS